MLSPLPKVEFFVKIMLVLRYYYFSKISYRIINSKHTSKQNGKLRNLLLRRLKRRLVTMIFIWIRSATVGNLLVLEIPLFTFTSGYQNKLSNKQRE